MKRARLSAVLTHPIQYYAPWFRYIASSSAAIELRVHYCVVPTERQQGVGFDQAFRWDSSLLEGYDNVVLRPPSEKVNIHSSSFFGVNVPEITKSVRAFDPDIVLVPGWYSASLVRAAVSARMRGLPVLYRGDSHHGAGDGNTTRHARIRTRAMLGLFTHYLTVGKLNREYLTSFGIPDASIFLAPHCVDNDFFAARSAETGEPGARAGARSELGIDASAFVVLFAGKMEEIKRPWDVIEAAALAEPGAVVVFAGSGQSEERCRAAAASSGTSVRFLGFRNQGELAKLYGLADCLVLPSASETWGLVVNEAFACGLPCIVSDRVGCGPDLIRPGITGEVYPAGDRVALARAVDAVRGRSRSGIDHAHACKSVIADYSFRSATAGLESATAAALGRS